MASLNRIFLIGNLTKDPELRYIPSGQAVCTIRIAVSEGYKTKAGEARQETTYLDVVVWARQAETVAQYLKKGSQVFVEGRLRIRDFEGRDGVKRYRTEVVANRVQFMGRPQREEAYAGGVREEAPAPAEPTLSPVEEPAAGETVEEPLPSYDEEVGN